MRRASWLFGNWKMHLPRPAARDWIAAFGEHLDKGLDLRRALDDERLVAGVAPTFTSLAAVSEAIAARGLALRVAAQNCHWEPTGAFTGEVSLEMIQEAGARHVIVGHSERRHIFGESDERIRRKVAAALERGVAPLLCVGETEQERDAERTDAVIETQLRLGLSDVEELAAKRVAIAYEPVWAIGTGKVAGPAQAQAAHACLRAVLGSLYGEATAREIPILYGGSVNPGNADGLIAQPDVDGFLVGGASLDAANFVALAEILLSARSPRGG